MAFEALPEILRLQGIQKELQTNPEGIFERMTQRNLSTGHFADAYKRTGLKPPVLMAAGRAGDTTLMRPNVRAGASSGNVAQDEMMRALEADKAGVQANPLAQPGLKPGTIIHTDPLFDKEEIKRRLGPARKKAAPVTNELEESEDAIAKRLGLK